MVVEKAISLFDFLLKGKLPVSKERYDKIRSEANMLVITPLKLMGYLVAFFGIIAMIFEVRYFSEYAVTIYLVRVTSTLIAIFILAILNSRFAYKYSILLVHTLLITIIASSGLMIYILPKTLLVNSQIVGLVIFTSALFLSWEVKNQIIVAIYYNVVFAVAILLNENGVYFLPNIAESVAFVLMLSMVSVIASAYSFKIDRKSTRLNSSHTDISRMPSSA